MSVLFPSSHGKVGIYFGADALPLSIYAFSEDATWLYSGGPQWKAALTGFALEGSSSLSINHTLRQRIYAYVAGGERAGRCQLSGLWFPGTCVTGGAWTGLDAAMLFYEFNRVSSYGRPIYVRLSPFTVLIGLMHQFRASVADTSTGVGEFSFGFTYMPRFVAYPGPNPGGPPPPGPPPGVYNPNPNIPFGQRLPIIPRTVQGSITLAPGQLSQFPLPTDGLGGSGALQVNPYPNGNYPFGFPFNSSGPPSLGGR